MAKQKRRRDKSDPPWLPTGRGAGQSRLQCAGEQIICAQDDPADAVFYIESGLVKMSIVSPSGKEAVVSLRGAGDFFGVRSLVGSNRRVATATALTDCTFIRIATSAMTRLLHEEPNFAEMYTTYLTRQHVRDQENLAELLTNSAEKRLARVLLQLANFDPDGNPGPIPTRISQALLADMIGTTRSRVNYFMNKFRRQGLIEYDRLGYLSVRNSLLRILQQG